MILTISIFVLWGIFNFEKIKAFLYFHIPYDMEIFYHRPTILGGYATTEDYHRINTKNKKEYIITDYYVYGASLGENGHHYSLKVKKLTDEQIKKLKEYAYGESTYIMPSRITPQTLEESYVTIKYDGQIKYYETIKY